MDFSKLTPMPHRVLLKISGQDRKDIFEKEYRRPDGTSFRLIVTVDEKEGFDRKAELYVQYAEVVAVGANVKNIQVGDTALMDSLVDNDPNVLVGWDGEDKYVSVLAISTYHKEDIIINASQTNRGDRVVAKKGQLNEASQIVGLVRGEKLMAIDPYVFLEHRKQGIVESESRIIYKDNDPLARTVVLAVSEDSTKRYGIKEGASVIVKHADAFDVKIRGGQVIFACNDEDVMCAERILGGFEGLLKDVQDEINNSKMARSDPSEFMYQTYEQKSLEEYKKK